MTRDIQFEALQIDRRSFCGRALITSAGVVLMTKARLAAAAASDQNLAVYPPQKIEGAERLLPGCFLYFNYPKREDRAVLVRGKDGEFVAFSRKCAHLGCVVEFDSTRQCIACPCHRGTYDARTGYVVYGPPPRPLDQIILQVRAGGEVWAVGKTIGNSSDRA
ncbi:MAG TPA: Rieske 2Fe-2S domain-containing protein [Pyrinomonadaceae bacterium]|nr:Rieske 2Fe-2S domain-containing protein [Pyrinomonadaceae bacterium]